jgi:hypothetical protein
VRVHRYATHLQLVDCANAGQRGQTCGEMVISDRSACNVTWTCLARAAAWIRTWADVERIGSYLEAAGFSVTRRALKACRVVALGRGPVVLTATCGTWHGEIAADGFALYDESDQYNLPAWISTGKTGARACGRVYRYVREHQAELEALSFHEVMKAIGTPCRAPGHYYCRMD